MEKFAKVITGFILGACPVLGAALMGILVYDAWPNFIGILVIAILVFLAVWVGIKIYKRVQIDGPSGFMGALTATPVMDDLESLEGSGVVKRTPEELVTLVNQHENLFNGGTVKIFGDWFGEEYNNNLTIESASFDEHTKLLTIKFVSKERLEIFNPQRITERAEYLKIIDADRVRLTFYKPNQLHTDVNLFYLDYQKEGDKIKTETDVTWYKPIFDSSIGKPALKIFG